MKKPTPYLLVLMIAPGLPAQGPKIPTDPPIYFYNPRLDAAGQSVAKAASEVANGQIFETQLANLHSVARLATDRIFSSGRRAALAKLEAARTWGKLYARVETARESVLPAKPQEAEWNAKVLELKQRLAATETKSAAAGERLKPAADLLEEVGKSQHVIQLAKFVQQRKFADITSTDLRVIGKLQDALDNLGTVLDRLSSLAKPASTRSAAEQMSVSLAKAEMDHLNELMQIEEKRLDGQHDLKGIIASIDSTLTCKPPQAMDPPNQRECNFKFQDDEGRSLPARPVAGTEPIETTLHALRDNPPQLKAVVFLLENFAALAARADTPVRLAELRSAIEERRYQIRRDAIMARAYEQVLLIGAQRIAIYYKGGIKPETLAQFGSALATAGLIPTLALK